MTKVLVVCAHPGDEILGCGGTMIHHVRCRDQVRVLVLGDGWTSRVRTIEKARDVIDLDVLERQGKSALACLGVDQVDYLRLPDNRFDTLPLLELVKEIERVKRSFAPDIVYTNSPYDLSVDQQKTSRAVITAFRPQPGDNMTALYSFEVPSSTEWNIAEGVGNFAPNHFVDISTVLGEKIEAYKKLSLEVRPWPHPRSPDAIGYYAHSRGAAVGLDAAETFVLLRSVRRFSEQAGG